MFSNFYLLLIYHSTFSFVKSSFGDLLYFEPFVFCKVNFLSFVNLYKLFQVIYDYIPNIPRFAMFSAI